MSEPVSAASAPLHVRIVRFFEARSWLSDTVFKVAPLLLLMVSIWWLSFPTASMWTTGMFGVSVNVPVMTVLELLAILPLAVVRIRPGWAAGVIAAGALGQMVALYGPGVSSLAVPLTVYACAKYGSRRVSLSYLVVAGLGALLVGVHVVIAQGFIIDRPAQLGTDWAVTLFIAVLSTGFCAAVVLASWLLGDLAGRRRREREAIAEKNRLLERERDQEARLAADAERMRIAREMHDVVSHSMSVMIAQADGGRYVLDADPARAADAFGTIGETGREALTELRRMLGVLREEDEVKTRPAPGVSDLPELIEDVRASGLPVQLSIAEPMLPQLSEGAALAVYRIVQEALTNTLKHGGPGATASVRLDTDAELDHLVLRVHDTGVGAQAAGDGSGSGLLGMTERVKLYGGTLAAQPRDPQSAEGGFAVEARFPLHRARVPQKAPQKEQR
ncbi:sensor histidine kinase [Garicola koreensis]|uniref:sensor histidine kinase n=1 Tax=Garicola koreensis TaxID=1262554 RepID=UPI0031F18C57